MTKAPKIAEDGLDALRQVLSLEDIMRMIELTARWVDPETFRFLPVWYPEYARRSPFYNKNWSEPRLNRNRESGTTVHKVEGNLNANKALTHALGLRGRERPNWSCCHIWGVDDPTYAATNLVVQDPRYFSCVANMVLLPTPLKAFTDVVPEVKGMLRSCAFYMYGWRCEHPSVDLVDVETPAQNPAYPASWPRSSQCPLPPGVIPISPRIKQAANRRMDSIRTDLASAGEFYPRERVTAVLEHWRIEL